MIKQELRDAVRNQLEVDEEELPNGQLDLYLADSFDQTIQREPKWRFLEFEWEVEVLNGEPVNVPTDLADIEHIYLYEADQLRFLDHGFAEEQFGRDGTLGQASFYSLRNLKIYLWPAPFQATQTLLVSGWRKPANFLTASSGAAPDCDSRLHLSLIWGACALAMARNEDEVMDSLYYQKWERGVERARTAIMRPDPARARILNGGLAKIAGRFSQWRFGLSG